MKETELINRWKEDITHIQLKIKLDELFSGYRITNLEQIAELKMTDEGLFDLRGYNFNRRSIVQNKNIVNADLSFCDLSHNYFKYCSFENVKFEKAKLNQISDIGNRFKGCKFHRTEFKGAYMGYEGSVYKNCEFIRADFAASGFIRGEYNDCKFINCKLRGTNFSASSFEYCEFEGKLINVRFFNGYTYDFQSKDFGIPRENAMRYVSFKNAELLGIEFKGGCDLSTVVIPVNGNYILVKNYYSKIITLDSSLDNYPANTRMALSMLIEYDKKYNQKQNWYIFNIDLLIEKYGTDVTEHFIDMML